MHSVNLILCSCRKKFPTQVVKTIWKSHFLRCSTLSNKKEDLKSDFEKNILKKIIYNEALRITRPKKREDSELICLKYITDEPEKQVENNNEEEESFNFPYQIRKEFITKPIIDRSVTEVFTDTISIATPSDKEKMDLTSRNFEDHPIEKNLHWVSENELENDNIEDALKFGSCDPHCPVSSVPCGGCGAFLHCTDLSIPGFLPQEIFKERNEKTLKSELCQRCHFLKEFNVALGVNVSPEEYPKIISHIKNEKALAIILVDLLDFPCSIWPDILDLVGKNPVFIVGNKVDLLIQEDSSFLRHIKKCLLTSIEESGMSLQNVLHVALISAKTGFGIEELINKIHKFWSRKGDIYLIGCTNTGKSTLFNRFILSDLCKVKAIDVLHKATVSAWPGTTLNLVKFPIQTPAKWKISARFERLKKETKQKRAYDKLIKMKHDYKLEQMPLTGYVGRTLEDAAKFDGSENPFDSVKVLNDETTTKGLDTKDPEFANSKWCYDTPGVVNSDQIVNLLTTPELLLTVPKNMLLPRNFKMKPGLTLFIGGIARLDYLNGTGSAWFTVYASKELPITVTRTEDADEVYEELLGSLLFRVPTGGKERLAKWPKLAGKKIELWGRDFKKACGDIVLSSAGWVSIVTRPAFTCELKAWTPEGKGIYRRKESILMTGHTFRGAQIGRTPAYRTEVVEVEVEPFLEDPSKRDL